MKKTRMCNCCDMRRGKQFFKGNHPKCVDCSNCKTVGEGSMTAKCVRRYK